MISRRDFLQASMAASAIVGGSGFGNWARLAAQQRLTQDKLLEFDTYGNVSLIHINDISELRVFYTCSKWRFFIKKCMVVGHCSVNMKGTHDHEVFNICFYIFVIATIFIFCIIKTSPISFIIRLSKYFLNYKITS